MVTPCVVPVNGDVIRILRQKRNKLMLSALPILYVSPRRNRARSIEFELLEASRDAVCAITQDLISESDLEFLPDTTLIKDMPALRSMKLKCGHEFSAMNLVYHWGRNRNALCPVCRGGPENAYLDLRGLPAHFKASMERKIRSERKKDAADRHRENVEAVRQIQSEENESRYEILIPNFVSILILGRDTGEEPFSEPGGIRLRCDFEPIDQYLLFTSRMFKVDLDRMGEFCMVGCLIQLPRVTSFRQSGWHVPDELQDTAVILDVDSMSCIYIMELQGDVIKVTWQINADLFRMTANQHLILMGL
jgi:hypothetical protein